MNLDDIKTAILLSDIDEKQALTVQLWQAANDNQLQIEGAPVESLTNPGLPQKVQLVAPKDLFKRGLGTTKGHQSMLHAIAHIEFNAINLALDAAYRFRQMPYQYYCDWLQIAKEEAEHFKLIAERLRSLGCEYGDFPAHNGLWEMCIETEYDVLVRMALVPRVMEARGLDVTPQIQQKLENMGDTESVKILGVIYEDEVGHVAMGSHWYKYCCEQRGVDYLATFRELLKKHLKNGISTKFNKEARLQAGFDDLELALLTETFQ